MIASENRHVLLQSCRTQMFYIRDNDWTSDPARARNFVTTQAAFAYSVARGLGDAQPVIHFQWCELLAPGKCETQRAESLAA